MNNTKMYNQKNDFTFFKKINDPFVYVFAFLIGLLILTLGSIFFVAPVISMSGFFDSIGQYEDIALEITKVITKYQAYLSIIPEIVGIGLIAIVFRNVLIEDGKKLIKEWWKNLIIITVAVLLIFLFGWIFDIIYQKLNDNPSSSNQELIESILKGDSRIIMILQVAIVAPIFEEFLFRKFPFGFLDYTKIHVAINTIIVAFVFAIIHCTGENFKLGITYVYLLNYFVLALILTLAYVLSKRNIYVSIIIHMINNIISLLSICVMINVLF